MTSNSKGRRRGKVVHVMGVRPHITKYTPIGGDVIVWTGQHYSRELYEDCWHEFGLPKVSYELNETDPLEMIKKTEAVLKKVKPACVVVYGDTLSTLAGAIAAVNQGIAIAHIEAGVRSSYQRVENFIRISVDRMATYNFCPTIRAMDNLVCERTMGKIFIVGDVHYDEYIKARRDDGFVLATFHRAEHTDTKNALERVIALMDRSERVVFPCHPRTRKMIEKFGLRLPANVEMTEPVSFYRMQELYRKAKLVITDSGGVTKEAHFAGCPVEPYEIDEWPEVFGFGDGRAKEKIRTILRRELKW